MKFLNIGYENVAEHTSELQIQDSNEVIARSQIEKNKAVGKAALHGKTLGHTEEVHTLSELEIINLEQISMFTNYLLLR